MKNKIQLVVFDMAGTTVEDQGNVAVSFINAFRKEGIDLPVQDVNKVMGFRKREAIQILLKNFYPQYQERKGLVNLIHDEFNNNMIRYYETTSLLRPLPFAEEAFDYFRKKNIGVALNTGFTRAITDTILNRLGWDNEKVDLVISSDEVELGRPNPAMIFELMKKMKIKESSRVVKIGDTWVDIAEGRNAGCGLVIAVTSGAYTRKELEPFLPDHIIDSLKQLPLLFESLSN